MAFVYFGSFTVSKADITGVDVSAVQGKTYNGKDITMVKVKSKAGDSVSFSYQCGEETITETVTADDSGKANLKLKDAGSYTVNVTVNRGKQIDGEYVNYKPYSESVDVEIATLENTIKFDKVNDAYLTEGNNYRTYSEFSADSPFLLAEVKRVEDTDVEGEVGKITFKLTDFNGNSTDVASGSLNGSNETTYRIVVAKPGVFKLTATQ